MLRLSTSSAKNGAMPAKKPYHRENLKESLLDAAVALIGESGPQAFTLREVARRAAVSHNAPYRHFRDKDDLLAAVAAQGFERLNDSMQTAMRKGRTAAERLRLAGRGYVQFALKWPQHIMVMFEGPKTDQPRPEHAGAASRAFETLLNAIVAAQAEHALPAGDPHRLAVVAWSGVHGLAKLAIGGQLPFQPKETLDFADYLSAVLSNGMAATASDGRLRG
jgi:AcrR family transcriptional regulator